jgi:hypothetical protein
MKHLIFSKAMVQLYFVMLVPLLEQAMISLLKHLIFNKAMVQQLYFVILVEGKSLPAPIVVLT